MPKTKLLLRDFLEKHLNEGTAKCLQWVDKGQKVFSLHWIHANSPYWSPPDAQIFKDWAAFKGRYQQNPDGTWPPPDYTTWKANFRCAVNRNHDIEEVKIEGAITRDKDFKIYRLLDRRGSLKTFGDSDWNGSDNSQGATASPPERIKREGGPPDCALNTDSYHAVSYPSDTMTQYVPEVVAQMVVSPPNSIDGAPRTRTEDTSVFSIPEAPQQLPIVDLYDLLQFSLNPDDSVSRLASMASLESLGIFPENSANIELPESLSLLTFKAAPIMTDMCVWLRYRENVVGKHYVRCDRGCRIMNSGDKILPAIDEKFQESKLIGTPSPVMTYSDPKKSHYIESTDRVLDALGNGLHLYCDKAGNIYATRLTTCRIYHADPTLKNAAEPVPLPRHRTVKVFDRETFEGRLREWRDDKGSQPSISVLFALGEPWSLTKPINKCHVTLTVVHAHSVFQKSYVTKSKGPDALAVDDDTEMCAALQSVSTGP